MPVRREYINVAALGRRRDWNTVSEVFDLQAETRGAYMALTADVFVWLRKKFVNLKFGCGGLLNMK